MGPATRKLMLTAHVGSAVGWLGAVTSFFALSIVGVTSANAQAVRASYIAMNLIGQFIIVPLSLFAMISGLVQALGTHWGLMRYYWVLTKFALTVAAATLLLLHQFTAVAEAARTIGTAGGLPDPGSLGTQLLVDSGAAVVLLLVTTTLSVYKPWGLTRYGQDLRHERAGSTAVETTNEQFPLGLRIFLTVISAIVAGIVVIHLAGRGLRHH